ncbi:MAG TPA: DMT family transporter [Rudaea sp.]
MDGSSCRAITAPAPAAAKSLAMSTAKLGALFVLVWSSGYIAGKYALAHAGAFTMLTARFAGAAIVFALLAWVARAPWPGWRALGHSAVVGVLTLALQFSGAYVGVQWGAEVGVAALVIGAMPLVTAVLAPLFGERVTARQWLGLALGLGGVLLVLGDRLHVGGARPGAYALLVLGLIGISIGTLYQKRFASAIDLRVGLTVQHVVAALALLPFAAAEGWRIDSTATAVLSLAWLIGINSVGGFALLFALLRRGAANRVAQLFFLIPPVTAIWAYLLFGEHFTVLKLAGFLVAALGVWIGTRAVPNRG